MMPSFSTAIIYLAKNMAKPKVIWETLQKCEKLFKTLQQTPQKLEILQCLNPVAHSKYINIVNS